MIAGDRAYDTAGDDGAGHDGDDEKKGIADGFHPGGRRKVGANETTDCIVAVSLGEMAVAVPRVTVMLGR